MSEQTVYTTDGRARLVLRQVGWRGQTGRLYGMGDDPARTERGGFAPLLIVAHDDDVADFIPDYPEVSA